MVNCFYFHKQWYPISTYQMMILLHLKLSYCDSLSICMIKCVIEILNIIYLRTLDLKVLLKLVYPFATAAGSSVSPVHMNYCTAGGDYGQQTWVGKWPILWLTRIHSTPICAYMVWSHKGWQKCLTNIMNICFCSFISTGSITIIIAHALTSLLSLYLHNFMVIKQVTFKWYYLRFQNKINSVSDKFFVKHILA